MLIVTDKIFAGGTLVTAIKLGGSGDVTSTHKLWQARFPRNASDRGSSSTAAPISSPISALSFAWTLQPERSWPRSDSTGVASRSGSWSSIVLVDGKLLIPNQSGEVFVVKASPELEVLNMNSIGEEITCASLALSDARVFLRTYDALWCWAAR